MGRFMTMLPFFAALFIDLFSFGLMYPVIVALFQEPAMQQAYAPETRTVLLSLSLSLFPLGMFFGASLLGDLSDALGRRRTLLICMAGLTASYGLMFLGVATMWLGWFLAGRLLSGLMAGTGPIAQAAMMDRSLPDERGRDMAHVVLVNCVALTSAPAVGGVLARVGNTAPLSFTVLLCLGCFALIYRARFAEVPHGAVFVFDWTRPFRNFVHAWRHPKIRWLALAFFLFQFGFAIYYVDILIFMGAEYHLTPTLLGLFSAVIGVGFVVGTVVGYPWASRRVNDTRIAVWALLLCGAAVLAAGLAGELAEWPIALVAALFNVLAYIALFSLIGAAAGADEQGWAMGIGTSAIALAFLLSGLLVNLLTLVPTTWLLLAGGVVIAAGSLPLRRASG